MKQMTIIGNIGSNAVRRTTADGRDLMTFSVAVSRRDADPVWFNCVGNFREPLFPFLVKGQSVCVIGDLSLAVYNGRPDATVNIDRIELVGRKPEDTVSPSQPSPAPQSETFGAESYQQQVQI